VSKGQMLYLFAS